VGPTTRGTGLAQGDWSCRQGSASHARPHTSLGANPNAAWEHRAIPIALRLE
jgi:hypothetical protein